MDESVAIIVTIIVVVLALAFNILIWWMIFKKAGYGGALGLLMIVPLVNLVLLLILAFGKWPVLRELEQLRHQLAYYSARGNLGTPQAFPAQPHGSSYITGAPETSGVGASLQSPGLTQTRPTSHESYPTCPSCGMNVSPGAKFCPRCGANLGQLGT